MLKNLKKHLESERDKKIFDIVIYGSAVKGKEDARDIDILVIFLEGTLKERLDKLQEIKSRLKGVEAETALDMKQILLKELFSSAFLARTGILLEGISVFTNKRFCETMGFKPFTLFWYSLKGLTHLEKVKFNYIFAGRNTKGVIEEVNGQRIVNGAIKVPIENSAIIESILKTNKVQYNKKNILEEA